MAKAYAGAADAATTGRGFRATALATLCVDGVTEGLAGLEDRHPLAAMATASPVCGLRPERAGRSLAVNFPKPAMVTVSPRARAPAMAEKMAPAAAAASAFDSDVAAARAVQRSDRFTASLPSALEGRWSTKSEALSRAGRYRTT